MRDVPSNEGDQVLIDPERLVKVEETVRYQHEALDELKNDLFAADTGRIHLLERRVTELEKTVWRILGALALAMVVVNLVSQFIGKK